MLELAWLLAAIELNGAVISRADRYALTEASCVIDSKPLVNALSKEGQTRHQQGSMLVFERGQCEFDPAETLIRLRLPLDSLASRRIQFGSNPSLMSIALLHDRSRLQTHPDYQSQPAAENIPAAAFDLFLGSGLHGAGVTFSRGPSLLRWDTQRTLDGQRFSRATADHLFADGASVQMGDIRTTVGVEQQFAELRGLMLTNRALILRGEGKAEATLRVPTPARIQFYDRQGTAIYASEILTPGNYQIQGYGASTIPGFIEARLIDINGQTQRIFIPWSADRRLLPARTPEWEIAFGHPRDLTGRLSTTDVIAARLHYGLSHQQTIGLRVDRISDQTRVMSELSTRALLGVIGTVAAGKACAEKRCTDLWLIETRAALGRRSQLIASHGQLITATLPPALPPTVSSLRPLQQQVTSQLSVSGALNARTSAALTLSMIQAAAQSRQMTQQLSINFRIAPRAHLQAQLRSDALPGSPSRWFGALGISFDLPGRQNVVNTTIGIRGQPTPNESRHVVTTEMTAGRPDPSKPTLSLSQVQDRQERTQAFFRYPSHYGDFSIRADSLTQTTAWSASTRLWVTPKGLGFGRAGEDNLVIQDLGIPAVKIHQAGRGMQVTDEKGIAMFRQVPPWTEARFTLDPKTIPFGVNLASSQIRIPMASHRAYFVSSRAMVTEAQVWRISNPDMIGLDNYRIALDRHQRRIFITPDGYVDLHSSDGLPILIQSATGHWVQCDLPSEKRHDPHAISQTRSERLLQCQESTSRDPQTASSLPSQS